MGSWNRFAQHLDLMSRMFAKTHALDGGNRHDGLEFSLRGAMFRCGNCAHAQACQQWLEENAEDSAPPAFCANAALIEQLRKAA